MAGPTKVVQLGGGTVPKVVKFKYLFQDDFAPAYANGAQGSVSSQGEIILNFYIERSPIPYSESHAVGGTGEVGAQTGREPPVSQDEAVILRQLTNGVVLTVATATRVHEMLGRILEAIEGAPGKSGERK